jgi:hypothetical protein
MSSPAYSRWEFWVLRGLVGVVGAILIYLSIRSRGRKRRQAWRQLAASLGFDFRAKDPFNIRGTLRNPFLRSALSPCNVMWGTYRNREIRCFDQSNIGAFTKDDSGDSRTWLATCVLVKTPIPFQPLLIWPQRFGKIDPLVGDQVVRFESDEFNRRFLVGCPDRKFAYDVVHEKTMEFLLRHDSLVIEGRGLSVLLRWLNGDDYLPLPDGVRGLLDLSCEFLDLLPAYLIQEKMGRS